ncbi:hypothetical protein [Hyalangium minutum]|uniref:Uncharacterized protein n=1 Tax=Hyalangium minutum TaxID=394096 RepID=A0A085W5B2_9BACT|nr:hypothetical protein [Hyalangium minutum]KFE62875.1 hypothetical protein DB31_2934 [Hyalangium minutum]
MSRNNNLDDQQIEIHLAKNLVRGRAHQKGDELHDTINAIRLSFPEKQLPGFMTWMTRIPKARSGALGITPVRSLRNLHRRRPQDEVPAVKEILWSALVLSQRTQTLGSYVNLSQKFARNLLTSQYDAALGALDEVDNKFGYSLWSIENRIATLQAKSGLEKQKEFTKNIKQRAKKSFAAFVAHYTSRRNEDSITLPRFATNFNRKLTAWELHDDLGAYLSYRITGDLPQDSIQLAAILRHDATASLVDLYETFLLISRHMLSLPDEESLHGEISQALSLLSPIGDNRITKLLYWFNGVTDLSSLRPIDGAASDAFWSGRYDDAIRASDVTLSQDPLDLSCMIIKARSLAYLQRETERSETLQDKMVSLLASVFGRTDNLARSILELAKLSKNYSALPIMPAVMASALLSTSTPAAQSVHALRLTQFACSSIHDPSDIIALKTERRAAYFALCEAKYGRSLAVLSAGVAAGLHVDQQTANALSREQLAEGSLQAHLEQKNFGLAYAIAQELLLDSNLIVRFAGARYSVECLLGMGKLEAAIEQIAHWCALRDSLRLVFPIRRIMDGRKLKSMRPFLKLISTPILFDLQNRLHETQDSKNNLRWSCDEFLAKNGLEHPSDIARRINEYDREQVLYFLKKICVQPVLEACRGLPTSRAIDEERINVCSLLVSLDPDNAEIYRGEIKSLATKLKIEEGVQIVDRSRVFVDDDAISRWAERELREIFDRYKEFLQTGPQSSRRDFELAVRDALTTRKPMPAQYLELPHEDNDALLIEMLEALWKEFLNNSEHGLDCFLSMRIRHGTLSGTLRGPLDDRKLITTRDEVTGTYKRNDFWISRLHVATPEQENTVDKALAWLSEKYDLLIEEQIKPVLHIRSEQHPQGVFGRSFNPFLVHAIRNDAQETSTFEDFLSLCFTMFRQQLSTDLESARVAIDGIFRTEAERIFQEVYSRLGEALDEWQYTELKNCLVTANTGAQHAMLRVADWLHLDESSDVTASFTIEQIIDIAVESALRTLRGFSPKIERILEADRRMGGTVLNEVTDIIFIALDNIYRHSKVLGQPAVQIRVKDDRASDLLSIDIESEIAGDAYSPSAEKALDDIRVLIGGDGYRTRVSVEGKSGLVKLKRIVSQYKAHALNFGFKNKDCFFLHVGMSLFHIEMQGRGELILGVEMEQ